MRSTRKKFSGIKPVRTTVRADLVAGLLVWRSLWSLESHERYADYVTTRVTRVTDYELFRTVHGRLETVWKDADRRRSWLAGFELGQDHELETSRETRMRVYPAEQVDSVHVGGVVLIIAEGLFRSARTDSSLPGETALSKRSRSSASRQTTLGRRRRA